MAEGLLRHDAGDRFDVVSAGTQPGKLRTEAVEVMKEVGIDISHHRSKSVDEFADQTFDYVLTVCDHAKETCPIYPGHASRLHHNFEDPAAVQGSEEQRLNAFRKTRDQIRSYLRKFMEQPILCTLTEAELRERRRTILAPMRAAVIGIEELPDGYIYTLRAGPDTLADLGRLIDLERQCCRFLSFKIVAEAGEAPVRLEITGRPEARPVIAEFFGAAP
jgi:arsenate reductase